MQFQPKQIASQLARGLAPVYVVAGEEPLLIQETLDAIRACARKNGYAEREILDVERGFEWQRVLDSCASLSLFASLRIVEVRMTTTPDDAGRKALQALASHPPQDVLLLVVCGELDKRQRESAWFKALDAAGVSVYAWPVKGADLLAWIAERLRAAGVQAEPEAIKLLAERTEGNLLAAQQDIDKLALLYPNQTIGVEALTQAVADSARFGAFDLNDRVLDGDAVAAIRSLDRMREEGLNPLEILGALAWSLRQLAKAAVHYARLRDADAACRAAGIFRESGRYARALSRIRPGEALGWFRRTARVDQLVKSGQEAAAWEELITLVLAASGAAKRAKS